MAASRAVWPARELLIYRQLLGSYEGGEVSETVDQEVLAELRDFDTPTLCNALELVLPSRQGYGFTRAPLYCVHPELAPMVGFARTAHICASRPSNRDPAAEREVTLAYYRHVAEPPHPTITVIEDIDREPVGAWWGEVHTHVHRGLGSLGVITDGTVRDLDQVAEGFQVLARGVRPLPRPRARVRRGQPGDGGRDERVPG